MIWTALVLAGSRPGTDPFAAAHGTDLKALIPLGGIPMVARPVAALLASLSIGHVRVLAQATNRIAAALPNDPRISVEPSGESIAVTLDTILSDPATPYPLLVTTADHGLLDAAMVEDFCAQASAADLAIGVVERRALMAKLPETRRTWVHFRGGAYSGANLFAFGGPGAARAVALWRGVEQDRKKGWRMIAALGFPLLLGAVLRLRTIDQTFEAVGRRLSLSVRKVELKNPIAAIDIDKESDLVIAEHLLDLRR